MYADYGNGNYGSILGGPLFSDQAVVRMNLCLSFAFSVFSVPLWCYPLCARYDALYRLGGVGEGG